MKIDFSEKVDNEKFIEKQSRQSFNEIHKSYTRYDSYTLKQSEIVMDKPIYWGFAVLELSKLLLYETYYDKIQLYFARQNLQLLYMDTDSFLLSINSSTLIKDLQKIEEFFDFSNLNGNH